MSLSRNLPSGIVLGVELGLCRGTHERCIARTHVGSRLTERGTKGDQGDMGDAEQFDGGGFGFVSSGWSAGAPPEGDKSLHAAGGRFS